jgi:hypothetical protein
MTEDSRDKTRRTWPLELDHPEVLPVLESVLNTLVGESDRGAVLIGTSVIDEYLAKAFRYSASPLVSKRMLDNLLKYPGPLSSFAATTDVAFATGVIGPDLHSSIHRLRKIRNVVAHSPSTFKLSEHHDELWRMYDVGPGVPSFINQTAAKMLLDGFCENIRDSQEKKPIEDRVFQSPKEVLERLHEMPDTMSLLQEKALRLELGIAIAMICALLVFHWERAQSSREKRRTVLRTGKSKSSGESPNTG